jgi:hypothetical protein
MEKHGELLFHKTHKLWFIKRGNIKQMNIIPLNIFFDSFCMTFIVWLRIISSFFIHSTDHHLIPSVILFLSKYYFFIVPLLSISFHPASIERFFLLKMNYFCGLIIKLIFLCKITYYADNDQL